MIRPLLLAVLVCLSTAAGAASLDEMTNLNEFGVPDVLGLGIQPYDERLFDAGIDIRGERCCERRMYRTDAGEKIVLMSHQTDYFLVILITDDGSRMFVADAPGVFHEESMEKGARFTVPDWVRVGETP